tara:strand:+ start:76 stop:435 length:360 start_codon:yes stop_codon:yes gene_type:complete
LPTTGLIEIENTVRVSLNYVNTGYYRPYLQNISGAPIVFTFNTHEFGGTNQVRDEVNVSIPVNGIQGVENNDIVFWTTANSDVVTTDLILPNGHWYEIQWTSFEQGNLKRIWISAFRKF